MVEKIWIKTVLNKHKRRDTWFLDDYSINPYSGCSFNCVYCYIRGSKYGLNMAKTLSAKINAPEILEKQLKGRAKRKEYGIIALSTSTEPYQRIEKSMGLTRNLLKIILRYRFPVEIATKSNLILRDLDLLGEIDKNAILPIDLKSKLKHGVIVSFSISTLDEKLSKILEPGAPSPKERLETMREVKEYGLLTGISYIPVLPFLSDSEEKLNEMIRAAKDCGADFVLFGALTLFGNGPTDCKTLYYKFLERFYPELLPKYDDLFKISFQPSKKYQRELEKKAKEICDKYGIKNRII